jgi:ketosteroid isomerase-like protein
MRIFRPLFVTLGLSVLSCTAPAAAAPTPAPPDPALLALPGKMAAALIANDAAALRANCASSATVVDEFSPYVWSGPDACAKWSAAFKVFAAQVKLENPKATVKPNPFVDVSGNRAYMTAQVRFDATMAGKPVPEEGTWTIVVVKSGGAWKITNLAWGTLHH